MKTKIQWTGQTWNPATGCTKISEGCKFCYAERMAQRIQKMGTVPQYSQGFKLKTAPHKLREPKSWKGNKLVFVCSMSDLFHKDIPTDYIKKVFDVMNATPQHTYQVLTKRIERANEIKSHLNWTENIWIGTSIENERRAIERVPQLTQIKAAKVRFLSVEPMLGFIPMSNIFKGVDWIICGGESGSTKSREIKLHWIREIRDICAHYRIPFFFKQWGKKQWNPNQEDPTLQKDHPHYAKGGCSLDGILHLSTPISQNKKLAKP